MLTVLSLIVGFFGAMIFASNSDVIPMYKVFVVQSGSMEPTIMTGDVIVVKDSNEYVVGDIITFNDIHSRRVTHRIFDNVSGSDSDFVTKGDANRTEDNAVVSKSNIIGKVVYTIPSLGYLFVFAKKPIGIIIFLIIPSVLILFDEVFKLLFRKNGK